MKNGINFLPLMVFLCVILSFGYLEANAQTYLPVGPQTNVPVATVTGGGWTECYKDFYADIMDDDTVLADCPGDLLMLSCRETDSSTLTLLAQGDRSDVTFDTGFNSNVLHTANGVGWYFNTVFSWGFVREGDSVSKNECDVDSSVANNERLCWHLTNSGGYRCGATENLNASVDFERIVYQASPQPVQPVVIIPTLSEWGLIAMAGVLGLVGFMVIRRRKLTA